jgi:2-polyprenyl-3-methyl-5-hydroxy-6-metoxy-1,4-benzoquinol methylase
MTERASLQKHFESLGYRFDWAPPRIHKELRRLMGRERHEYLQDQGDVIGTPYQEVSLYSLPQTLREAAILFSLDGNTALTTSYIMSTALKSYLRSGMRVADMGCGIGGLVSWLSAQYPDVEFQGVEAAENLVKVASERFNNKNLSIVCRDYDALSQEVDPFDVIFSVFGMETVMACHGACFALDIDSMRGSSGHQQLVSAFAPTFKSWRGVARDDAKVLMFVRASSAQVLLAIVDAAERCGWEWAIDESRTERIDRPDFGEAYVEKIPLVAFVARPDGFAFPGRSALEVFCWYSEQVGESKGVSSDIDGARAMLFIQELLRKGVIEWKVERNYDDGHTMQSLIVSDADKTYLIRRATTDYCTVSVASGLETEAKIQAFKNDPFNDAARDLGVLF